MNLLAGVLAVRKVSFVKNINSKVFGGLTSTFSENSVVQLVERLRIMKPTSSWPMESQIYLRSNHQKFWQTRNELLKQIYAYDHLDSN